MTSFKYHCRPSSRNGSTSVKLFVRVIHKRRSRDILTAYAVDRTEWDEKLGRLIFSRNDPARNEYLTEVDAHIRNDLSALRMITELFAKKGNKYDVVDIVEGYKALHGQTSCLLAFAEQTSVKLIDSGQSRTARAYRSAVRSLLNFRAAERVFLEDISASLMRDFELYLMKRKLQKNTISFYMRNLRALYYRAIDQGLIRPQIENPFAHVQTGVYQSRKRALDMNDIRDLHRFQEKLSHQESTGPLTKVRKVRKTHHMLDAIRYFWFCLEARGMSWVDMVYLKKTDVGKDTFTYVRKKTRQQLEVLITPAMREVIAYFGSRTPSTSPYLFPILDPVRGNERKQYETALRLQNERLSQVSQMAGIKKTITTHVSRHSWATIAKREKIDISVISELLGHNNIKTTMRYLASFDKTEMERATEQVTRALKKAS